MRVDVTPNTLVAVRPGPNGLAGVWVLPPKELVALALDAVDRSLTEQECRPFYIGPCPPNQEVPVDLVLYLLLRINPPRRAGDGRHQGDDGPLRSGERS